MAIDSTSFDAHSHSSHSSFIFVGSSNTETQGTLNKSADIKGYAMEFIKLIPPNNFNDEMVSIIMTSDPSLRYLLPKDIQALLV